MAVVGSANIDHVMRVPRLPQRGETVGDGAYLMAWGGRGANQAVAARRAGTRVKRAACIGDDPLSRRMLEDWRPDGIDTAGVTMRADHAIGTALVLVGGLGDNYLAVAPGARRAFAPEDLPSAIFAGAGVCLLQNEVPAAVNRRAAALARTAGCRLVVNIAPATSADAWLLAADLVVVNEVAAAALCVSRVGAQPSIPSRQEILALAGAAA